MLTRVYGRIVQPHGDDAATPATGEGVIQYTRNGAGALDGAVHGGDRHQVPYTDGVAADVFLAPGMWRAYVTPASSTDGRAFTLTLGVPEVPEVTLRDAMGTVVDDVIVTRGEPGEPGPPGEDGPPGEPGPKGDPGNLGTTLIYGAGRPDVPSSMTPETSAAVTAATSGAEFISTDGAGVGAWRWQKLGTTWTVTVGDTGWRAITTLLTQIPTLQVRRVNWDVLVMWPRAQDSNQLTDRASLIAAPTVSSGFYLAAQTPLVVQSAVNGGQVAALIHDSSKASWDLRITGASAPQWLAANTRFATTSAWPTSLPGSAA